MELNIIAEKFDDKQLTQIRNSIDRVDHSVRNSVSGVPPPEIMDRTGKPLDYGGDNDDDVDSLSIDLGFDYYQVKSDEHNTIEQKHVDNSLNNYAEGYSTLSPLLNPNKQINDKFIKKGISEEATTNGEQTKYPTKTAGGDKSD